MRLYANLYARGFAIVCLTAINVVNVTHRHWLPAFVTGFGISLVWRWNARNAVRLDTRTADAVYALGAACGTVSGMWLSGMWRG